jgi:eukaryotic-like serine/threonine-protein kinase
VNSPTGDARIEVFGPYEVFEQLGVGGMATVHRAKKRGIEGFQQVVALKRLLSHLAEDQSFVKSFVREARLASYLQHANIIQIYDLGLERRVYFIAMEFVRGHDLRKILRQTARATGPMPVPMMLALTRQLCDALDYAHSRADDSGEPLGIVHRDISPSNLLVSADGHLKVIDFGIAKATTASLRTHSGRVKGKFSYMAPESIRGQPLDHRSDIFSVGIVAYEMLTAQPLFAARSEYDTLQKITELALEPPSRRNPFCPPDLDDIVLTALSRSPDERWQSAGAMMRALDTVARKLALQATNREVAEWVEWAFAQPLQSERVSHGIPNQPVALPALAVQASLSSSSPSPGAHPRQAIDQVSIEMVWGTHAAPYDELPTASVSHPIGREPGQPRSTPQAVMASRPSGSTLYGLAPPPATPPRPRTSTASARAHAPEPGPRAMTPVLARSAAHPVPEHDTLLDQRAPFAEEIPGAAAFQPAPPAAADSRDSGARASTAAARRGGRTALWLVLLAALFAGAAVGGYYLVPGGSLDSSGERARSGDDPGAASAGPGSEGTPGQRAALPADAADASAADGSSEE